jgi:AcrR family transcriptional regulator
MLIAAMAEELQPGSIGGSTDPRILRSRQMLMEALVKLLAHKEFDDISIQEIADEATLNRATFYLHYPDKHSLLQAMTAARFRDLIVRRGLSFTNCDGALRAIALVLLCYKVDTTLKELQYLCGGMVIPCLHERQVGNFRRPAATADELP